MRRKMIRQLKRLTAKAVRAKTPSERAYYYERAENLIAMMSKHGVII